MTLRGGGASSNLTKHTSLPWEIFIYRRTQRWKSARLYLCFKMLVAFFQKVSSHTDDQAHRPVARKHRHTSPKPRTCSVPQTRPPQPKFNSLESCWPKAWWHLVSCNKGTAAHNIQGVKAKVHSDGRGVDGMTNSRGGSLCRLEPRRGGQPALVCGIQQASSVSIPLTVLRYIRNLPPAVLNIFGHLCFRRRTRQTLLRIIAPN